MTSDPVMSQPSQVDSCVAYLVLEVDIEMGLDRFAIRGVFADRRTAVRMRDQLGTYADVTDPDEWINNTGVKTAFAPTRERALALAEAAITNDTD